MDIKQLITFRTLAQEKNYMKTSEKLSYAPSTLAKHIRSLEDELQVQLVEYRNGKIELTYDGKRFMRYADEMLSVYFKLQYEFDQTKSAIGTIRVAGGELMVGFAFGDFFAAVEKTQPELTLQVNAICCARVPEWLNQNEVDIGFVQMLNTQAVSYTHLDVYKRQDKAGAMAANSDVGGSIKLLTDTTLALDKKICETLQALQPDCIVADSMAVWGKFAALKLGIPLISSTTTFAFNRYSAKIMKQSFGQLFSLCLLYTSRCV